MKPSWPGWRPLLARLYARTLDDYRAALDEQSGLDFDDLEAGTVALLRIPAVRAHWQAEVAAVLVDEFQDTNARQREIILALCGERARAPVRGRRRPPEHLPLPRGGRDRVHRPAGRDPAARAGWRSTWTAPSAPIQSC